MKTQVHLIENTSIQGLQKEMNEDIPSLGEIVSIRIQGIDRSLYIACITYQVEESVQDLDLVTWSNNLGFSVEDEPFKWWSSLSLEERRKAYCTVQGEVILKHLKDKIEYLYLVHKK